MRVTNSMLMNRSMWDLDKLREKYRKAQDMVNGRVLDRPSEDPQRVVEAMDLSGAKIRLERAKHSGEDAKDWLSVSEASISSMIEQLHSAREIALQAGGPGGLDEVAREGMARQLEGLKESLLREMNSRRVDQYQFGGWKTDAEPFQLNATGGVDYVANNSGEIIRDIAPGLSIVANVPGDRLLSGGDPVQAISDTIANLRSGNTKAVLDGNLKDLTKAQNNLIELRSELGVRSDQVEQYEAYADQVLLRTEERLTKITGGDLEKAVLEMMEVQTAYQAALASFAKALPQSLIDYLR